jgi:iron complex transport system substrate-binding protein
VISKEYPSYEALLAAEPDLVYGGWKSAFEEKEGRSRAALKKAGINTRLNIEECPKGPVTMATVEEEIRTVAKIFGVAERAEQRISSMRTVLGKVESTLSGAAPVKVAVYDSGDKTVFTAGGTGIGNEMIRLAGGTNLFADVGKPYGDVSFEQWAISNLKSQVMGLVCGWFGVGGLARGCAGYSRSFAGGVLAVASAAGGAG